MNVAELRFLAVEDHEFQRAVLLRILAGLGATKVRVAADGREALKITMAPAARVDIIIIDLDLPGMDGMELMRHLGEARVPVSIILASALEDSLLASIEVLTRSYGVRILGVIEKPVMPAKLKALIGRHERAAAKPDEPRTGSETAGRPFLLEELVERLRKEPDPALSAAPVDRAVLGAICGGDAVAEREILAAFRRVNDADAAVLERAVGGRDAPQVTHASHHIKGASSAIGAIALAAVCERLERAGTAADWKAVEADMATFHRELERLNSYCESAGAQRTS